jgi:Phosphotransferase enzyme family
MRRASFTANERAQRGSISLGSDSFVNGRNGLAPLSSDGQNIVGVIDWTDVEIGDPAFDFGYLWVWHGEPFVREVLRHYQGDIDPGFIDRACAYGVCSAVADCYYGIMAGIERNRRIGIAALERSFTLPA